jgi:restriction system protein
VDRETAGKFFQVGLWDRDELITQLLEHYERLSADVRAELPLKRIWMLAAQDEE